MHYEEYQVKLEMLDPYEEIVWEDSEVHSLLSSEEEK